MNFKDANENNLTYYIHSRQKFPKYQEKFENHENHVRVAFLFAKKYIFLKEVTPYTERTDILCLITLQTKISKKSGKV